jgi:hypothetical protein
LIDFVYFMGEFSFLFALLPVVNRNRTSGKLRRKIWRQKSTSYGLS